MVPAPVTEILAALGAALGVGHIAVRAALSAHQWGAARRARLTVELRWEIVPVARLTITYRRGHRETVLTGRVCSLDTPPLAFAHGNGPNTAGLHAGPRPNLKELDALSTPDRPGLWMQACDDDPGLYTTSALVHMRGYPDRIRVLVEVRDDATGRRLASARRWVQPAS